MARNLTQMTCRNRRRGFTVAELIVACVVMSVILGGVYSVFYHCVRTEARSTLRMGDCATAAAVISELTGAVANAVILSGSGPIRGSFRGHQDGGSFTCKASIVARSGGQPRVVVQRMRYRWAKHKTNDGIVLTFQGLPFAGTKCIHPLREGEQPLSELWDKTPPVTIAKRIDVLSVKYRAAGDATGPWLNQWQGQKVPAVWISVRIADETKDAVIVPKVQGRLVG